MANQFVLGDRFDDDEVVVKHLTRFRVAVATYAVLLLAFVSPSLAGEPQPLMGIKGRDLRGFRAGAIAKSDYPVDGGVLVTFVYPDGPATDAGLETDDIIASSGGTAFNTAGEFIEWLKTTSDGKRYPLVIWRYEDTAWTQREVIYRAVWGIRDAPFVQGAAWDGPLYAKIAEPIVYVAGNEPSMLWSDGTEFVVVEYDGDSPIEGFFKVDGTPTKVSIISSDDKVLKVTSTVQSLSAPRFRFIAPGKVNITVEVGKRKVTLPLRVEFSPVSPGDSADHVVKTIGLPDWKSDITVFWPESDRADRFFYSPSASESFIEASHWRYKKYPGLVLSMRDSLLKEISSDYNGVPVDENQLTPAEDLRRWTAKSGHTLDASFVRFRRGRVTLKDTAGKSKDIKITDLSNVDRDYVRRKVRNEDRKK